MKKILCVLLAVSLILTGHGSPCATAGAEEVLNVVTEVAVDGESQEELVEAHVESALEKVTDSVKEEVPNVVTEVTVDSEAQEELVEAHVESALEKVKNSAKVAAEKAKNSYNKVSAKTKELSALSVKKMKSLGEQAEAFYAGLTSKQKTLMLAGATTVVGGAALGLAFHKELSKMVKHVLGLYGCESKPERVDGTNNNENSESANRNGTIKTETTSDDQNAVALETEANATLGNGAEKKLETSVEVILEVDSKEKTETATTLDGSDDVKSEAEEVATIGSGDEVKAATEADATPKGENDVKLETESGIVSNANAELTSQPGNDEDSFVNGATAAISTEDTVTSLVNGTADAVSTEENVTSSVNTTDAVIEAQENNETSSWKDTALDWYNQAVGFAKDSTLKAVDYLQEPPVVARVIGGAAGLVLSVVTFGLFNRVYSHFRRGANVGAKGTRTDVTKVVEVVARTVEGVVPTKVSTIVTGPTKATLFAKICTVLNEDIGKLTVKLTYAQEIAVPNVVDTLVTKILNGEKVSFVQLKKLFADKNLPGCLVKNVEKIIKDYTKNKQLLGT